MALDCDRKRLERVLWCSGRCGWVDTLKRRIREIRGLYGHVAHCMDLLAGCGQKNTCYAGCCLLRRMRRPTFPSRSCAALAIERVAPSDRARNGRSIHRAYRNTPNNHFHPFNVLPLTCAYTTYNCELIVKICERYLTNTKVVV